MEKIWKQLGFGPADIMLPKTEDMQAWSVVACDQYTSEPEYWDCVEERVGDAPSTLRLILPEARLDDGSTEEMTAKINCTMEEYLDADLFETYPESLIYVERTLSSGKVRRGIMGQVDLQAYDYHAGASSLIRATEKTVLERIPPRVAIRRHALLDLPHIMMLMDDPQKAIIEVLSEEKDQMQKVYDFELMEESGHIAGYLLNQEQKERMAQGLLGLADPQLFEERYQAKGKAPLLFAIGDGNHSLASAKVSYIEKEGTFGEKNSRYALVELVNLHDDSLEFEAIHRVCFGVDADDLLASMKKTYPNLITAEVEAEESLHKGQSFLLVTGNREIRITVPDPVSHLAVGTLQTFLDRYMEEKGKKIDYIHGEDVVRNLCKSGENVGFLLAPMKKSELYPTVIHDGVLPRKTFSMGEARDKRFYLESRRL